MKDLLRNGYKAKKRPSGHDISEKFNRDNGAAIPPNLIALAHTESNSYYLRYCKERGIEPHPARYPAEIPEYFIRMLTDPGHFVVDPFAGSCVTGAVAERLERRWACVELEEEYLKGAMARFEKRSPRQDLRALTPDDEDACYKVFRPGLLWNGARGEPLPEDGGRKRRIRPVQSKRAPGSFPSRLLFD